MTGKEPAGPKVVTYTHTSGRTVRAAVGSPLAARFAADESWSEVSREGTPTPLPKARKGTKATPDEG